MYSLYIYVCRDVSIGAKKRTLKNRCAITSKSARNQDK